MVNNKIVIFGLSTQGYSLASQIAIKGNDVHIIDESAASAILINADIAKTYPTVSSLKDDEPILSLIPTDVALSTAEFLFFAPRIRKTGQDIKIDINSKFKDTTSKIKKGCSVVYNLPTGLGGNNENISLLEHVTGLTVGKKIYYYYYPLGTKQPDYIGSFGGEKNKKLEELLKNKKNKEFLAISSSELIHSVSIMSRFSELASFLEICRFANDKVSKSDLISNNFSEIYLDTMINDLFDLRSLSTSFDGPTNLAALINICTKSIDGYIKRLIDEIRLILKKNELKASKTKILLSWSLDEHDMKGDKAEMLENIILKLRDYIGDVDAIEGDIDLFNNEKTVLVIACSQPDYEKLKKNEKEDDRIIIKANPIFETIQ